MASKETRKAVAFGAATGGVLAGAEHATGISTSNLKGFSQQVQGNGVKFAANSAVRMAFGEKPKDVLRSAGVNYVADVAAGLASNKISDWRQGSIVQDSVADYITHKGLHFATGAISRGAVEAALGGNSSAIRHAAVSGGMGAATAEIIGEKLALDALGDGRLNEANRDIMMGHISALSSQTAGLGAALTGLDVSHAQHAGSVAVENNVAPLVVWLVAAGIAAMKVKDVYDTADGAIDAYQKDGTEGVVDFGVDEGIGMLAGGTMAKGAKYAGKAIKAAEKVLPESVTKAVGKTLGKAANSAGGVLKEATAVLDSAKGKVKATVKSGLGVRGKKEQPWNIREGQEWKGKVIGRAQKTGTDGHSFRSYREAIKSAKQDDVDKVLLNRGVNRVLDQKIRPNRRPDVTVIRKNGRIDQVEVPSKTDNIEALRARMDDTSSYFPGKSKGNNIIKDIR